MIVPEELVSGHIEMNVCRKIATSNSLVGKNVVTAGKDFSERTMKQLFRSASTNLTFDMNKEQAEFLDSLPGVIDVFAKHPKFKEVPEAETWMRKVLNGTLKGGKHRRGVTTVMTYKSLADPEKVTEETLRQARTLGWCTEIFQAHCVVLDDIADQSVTRRGEPCWYRREDVGISNATNDSTLHITALLYILQANFESSPNYLNYIHSFNETLFFTSVGQRLDVLTGLNNDKNRYDLFTMDRYDIIGKHKSSYYTYKLPITLGYMLANKFNEDTNKTTEDIAFQLGKLFQMQDDYIDCFGDENITGKVGSDIEQGKCTWLAVKALQRCSKNDRAVFSACYGSQEPAHAERIKQLYVKLQIPQLYKQEEKQIYDNILQRIQTLPSTSEREMFFNILSFTYGRKH